MGIGANLVVAMIREHAFRPITGDVLFIGRQTVYFNRDEILTILEEHGRDVSAIDLSSIDVDTLTIDRMTDHVNETLISDSALVRLVTDGTPRSLDVSDYEGADIIHDLNLPLPQHLYNVADFIIDGSTLDNTFNPTQTLKNYADLLRPGGRLLMVNAFSADNTAYCIMPPMWYLDYFVVNGFLDAKAYVAVGANGADQSNVLYLDPDYLLEHKRSMGRLVTRNPMSTIIFAEKGPKSTTDVFPVQQDYRSARDWNHYCNNLIALVNSDRPHLVRSRSDLFLFGLSGGHMFVDENFNAAPVPNRRALEKPTALFELPPLPKNARWDTIIGVYAEPVASQLSDGVIPTAAAGTDNDEAQATPIDVNGLTNGGIYRAALRLTATRTEGRHGIAAHFYKLPPETVYRVTFRVKVLNDVNIMIEVRDGANGPRRNECELRIDAETCAVVKSESNHLAESVEVTPDGWLSIWVDIASHDGSLFPSLGMLEVGRDLHIFAGVEQEILFGGFEIVPVREVASASDGGVLGNGQTAHFKKSNAIVRSYRSVKLRLGTE